jgi:hypothetical protein
MMKSLLHGYIPPLNQVDIASMDGNKIVRMNNKREVKGRLT